MKKRFKLFSDAFAITCKKCGSQDIDVNDIIVCSECGIFYFDAKCKKCGNKYDYTKKLEEIERSSKCLKQNKN